MNEIMGWVIRDIELILIGMMVLMVWMIYIELKRKILKLEEALLIACQLIIRYEENKIKKEEWGEGLGRMKIMEEKEEEWKMKKEM